VVTITPTVTISAFSPATSIRWQGAGIVTTTTTASNNSSAIVYSLDGASLTGGNTINSSTGAVTYVASWSGTTTITANANGCNGPATTTHIVTSVPVIKVQLSVFLEASYNIGTELINTSLLNASLIPLSQPFNTAPWDYLGTENAVSIPSHVVDWILVELRQATSPELATSSTILAKRAAFLKSDGSIVDLDGTSAVQFNNSTVGNGKNLYVVIRHRNHLAIMSASGAILTGDAYSYNFTTGLAQAFGGGNGYKQIGTGKYAMVAGDIDQDGNIFVSDYNRWAIGFGTTNGYFYSDLDMDGNVFVSDYNKWAINFGSTIDSGLKSAPIRPKYVSCVPK
jgi:hypothetical protein